MKEATPLGMPKNYTSTTTPAWANPTISSNLCHLVPRFCAGCLVVARWGYHVGEVIAVTPGVAAWTQGVAINSVPLP